MPHVVDSCPPCSFPCCCCTPCGACMPEYLYLEFLTVTGAGSANWAWIAGAVAALKRRSEEEPCPSISCDIYSFLGMMDGSTLVPADCLMYPDGDGCAPSVFALARVYEVDETTRCVPPSASCPCDPTGDAIAGIGNDGLLFGTETCITCFDNGGIFTPSTCSCEGCFGEDTTDRVVFGMAFNFGTIYNSGPGAIQGVCYCSKLEAALGVERCDPGPDSPSAQMSIYRTACGSPVGCLDYCRTATSCIPGSTEEIPCPTVPPAVDHTLVWDAVVCDEETGAFVSQAFTATFKAANSCCASDGIVVITGILYA